MQSTMMGTSTGTFMGVAVNAGSVMSGRQMDRLTLSLSDDFMVPGTPDPHWQVVDSMGNVTLLNRLAIDGGKVNRTITVPASVKDVARVQIWCGFAEVVLGEASFSNPVR